MLADYNLQIKTNKSSTYWTMPHIGTTIPQMLEELWTPLLTKKKKKLKK